MEDVGDFYANLKQDVSVECRKAGEVDKVTLFEGSELGVAAVKFKLADDAQRCAATHLISSSTMRYIPSPRRVANPTALHIVFRLRSDRPARASGASR